MPHLLKILILLASTASASVSGEPPFAAGLRVVGPIGPATADYLNRGFKRAVDEGAEIILLQMNTPGGLASSMRSIIQEILASPIPVITFVYPGGARAASAGTYILYASHVAAMAPATNLGAATPVQVGGTSRGDKGDGDVMSRKAVNDAVAYIRGLARLRGRNAEWAEKAVREAASLTAEKALDEKVIDVIARDPRELLQKIDGRVVQVDGAPRELNTDGLALRWYEPDWRTRLLSVITDPNIAYILMLIGIYGLVFEFLSPGTIVPGVLGGISLVLALFAFQVLPINYAGIGLILLGLSLMVAEAFAPSFGILGFGGVLALVLGSVILMDTEAPGFGISLPLIFAVALVSLLLFVFVLGLAYKSRRRPVVSGAEELVGEAAVALEDFEQTGQVRAHSEIWQAHADKPVRKGQLLRITGRKGLLLEVAPRENDGKGMQT